jgi:hypothetical protein
MFRTSLFQNPEFNSPDPGHHQYESRKEEKEGIGGEPEWLIRQSGKRAGSVPSFCFEPQRSVNGIKKK